MFNSIGKKIQQFFWSLLFLFCFSSTAFAMHQGVPHGGGPPEVDPVFTASPANGITGGNITDWTTAFGWGDHATAGYLNVEVDPVFTASPANGITGGNITDWTTAFGWGDHSTAGYLNAFVETDPILGNSIESGEITDGTITTDDIGDGEVRTADIQDNAITGDKVSDGSITSNDIADGPGSLLNADMVDGMHAQEIIDAAGFWEANGLDIFYNGGNVGVGTLTPDEKLEVVGTIKIVDGNQGENKVLTSDANGVGSWQSIQNFGIPSGAIIMWSGQISNIPTGWALCDGTNGTPDLRDRMIVGATQDNNAVAMTNITGELSQEGGSTYHAHQNQTGNHALTNAEMPAHNHQFGMSDARVGGSGPKPALHYSASITTYYSTSTTGGGGSGNAHNHNISSDYHIPPYYALAYILKL